MANLKGVVKFPKTYVTLIFDKILQYTKRFLLKNLFFFMFFAHFIFVVSHLKIQQAVHLSTSKALTSL